MKRASGMPIEPLSSDFWLSALKKPAKPGRLNNMKLSRGARLCVCQDTRVYGGNYAASPEPELFK